MRPSGGWRRGRATRSWTPAWTRHPRTECQGHRPADVTGARHVPAAGLVAAPKPTRLLWGIRCRGGRSRCGGQRRGAAEDGESSWSLSQGSMPPWTTPRLCGEGRTRRRAPQAGDDLGRRAPGLPPAAAQWLPGVVVPAAPEDAERVFGRTTCSRIPDMRGWRARRPRVPGYSKRPQDLGGSPHSAGQLLR